MVADGCSEALLGHGESQAEHEGRQASLQRNGPGLPPCLDSDCNSACHRNRPEIVHKGGLSQPPVTFT